MSTHDSELRKLRSQIASLDQKDAVALLSGEKPESDNSERHFQSLFENNHTIMLLIDPETGSLVDCNQAAAVFYGFDREQLNTMKLQDLSILGKDETLQALQKIKTNQRRCFHFKHRRADGVICDGDLYGGMMQMADRDLLYSIVHDVSENRRAIAALQKSKDKLKSIFRASPIGIGLVVDRHFVEVNKRFCNITGYSKDELLGSSSRMLYANEKIYQWVGKEKYDQIRQTGTGTVDTQFQTKDGKIVDVLLSSTPVDPNDLNAGITVTVLDISKRKQVEKALRESEHRLTAAGKVAYDLIWEWDVSRNDLKWFGDYQELLGYNIDELEHGVDSWLELIHPDDRQSLGEILPRITHGKDHLQHEFRVQHKDGNYRYWSQSGLPSYDDKGNITKWVGVCTDITEKRKAKEDLQKHQIEIDAIYQNAPLFMLLIDQNFQIRKMNQPTAEMTGSRVDKVHGKSWGEALRCLSFLETPNGCGFGSKCSTCPVRNSVTATLNTETNVQGVEATFSFVRDQKEHEMSVLLSTVFLRLPDENMVLVCMQNITELKRTESERELFEQQFYQAQRLESIGRLAGGVAHDLNNLLSPILGYGEMLVDSIAAHDPRRNQVQEVVNAGLRARDLVRQLLAFSRKQTLEFKTFDLNGLIQDFRKLLRRTIREDVQLTVKLDQGLPFIQGDVGQLEQVVMNLVVNSQDALEEEGEITIETSKRYLGVSDVALLKNMKPGAYVMLAVTDNGCGMDSSVCDQIFEPFFTTKSRDRGTGLGLATVYGIVQQHNGNIVVSSIQGEGTTFTIYLPVAEDKGFEPHKKKKEPWEGRIGVETVMVVEDDKDVRKLASTILGQKGYTVLAAKGGNDALQLLERYDGQVDLLLTDVVMPEMNGKQLHDRMVLKYPKAKVLFMSGYSNNVIAYRGVLNQEVNFIQKPFSYKLLLSKVREVLDQESPPD